jgi:hypothetical protein
MVFEMATEKGFIKDDDRFTKRHQDMCLWFANEKNVRDFIRFLLVDVAVGPNFTLEKPVVTSKEFLFGYADVFLSYTTDQSRNENVLIEVKSSLSDYGAVLRQIRTYQQYLANITKTILVYDNFKSEEEEDKATKFFVSQKIYFVSLKGIIEHIDCCKNEESVPNIIPAGKRGAELCAVSFSDRFWDFDFLVSYDDKYLGRKMTDLIASENFVDYKDSFLRIVKQVGIDIDIDKPVSLNLGDIAIDCFVDLAYRVDEIGYPRSVILGVYINDNYIELVPDKLGGGG